MGAEAYLPAVPVLGMLWGLFKWREFDNSGVKSKALLALLLAALGALCFILAPYMGSARPPR